MRKRVADGVETIFEQDETSTPVTTFDHGPEIPTKATGSVYLKKFENYLVHRHVLTTSFENYVNGVVSTYGRNFAIFQFIFSFHFLIRFTVLLLTDSTLLINVLGDYHRHHGLVGFIILLLGWATLIIALALRGIMMYCDRTVTLHFIPHFYTLTQTRDIRRTGLTAQQFAQFEATSKRVYVLVVLFDRSIVVLCVFMHVMFPVLGYYKLNQSIWLVLWQSVWVLLWLYYVNCNAVSYASVFALGYLATLYLTLRYESFNETVQSMVSHNSGNNWLYGKRVMNSIRKQTDLMVDVARYNESIRWLIGALNFMCSPLASLCIFIVLYVPIDVILVRESTMLLSVEIICLLFLMASVLSYVNRLAKKPFSDYNSIFVHNNDTLKLHHKRKLLSVIKAIGSSHEISFYCLDFFPYGTDDFFTFTMTSLTTFLMITKLIMYD